MDGLPYLFQGGHFEPCASYELVQQLQVHDKVVSPIFHENQEGICEESFVPWATSVVPLDSIDLTSEAIMLS